MQSLNQKKREIFKVAIETLCLENIIKYNFNEITINRLMIYVYLTMILYGKYFISDIISSP